MGASNNDRLLFNDNDYREAVLSYLNTLRKNARFCDVTLEVGQHIIRAHRAVLASISSTLFELFATQEAGESCHCKLKDYDYESVDILVNYAYTSRLEISADQVKPVYRAATRLKMHRAAKACSDFLAQKLNAQNCIGIRTFAHSYSDSDLTLTTDKFIQEHIDEVALCKEVLTLPRIQVEIIGADTLDLTNSKDRHLLGMVVRWLETSVEGRKTLNTFMDHVNVLYLSADNTLRDCENVDDFSLNNADIIKDYKKLKKKRHSAGFNTKEVIVNGKHSSRKQPADVNGRELEKEWTVIASKQTADHQYLCIAMLDDIVCTISLHLRSLPESPNQNGHDGSISPQGGSPSNSRIGSINGDKASLTPLAQMSSARSGFGTVILKNKIVAVGGYDRGECLATAEEYDIKTNTWTSLPPMSSPRGRLDVGGCCDKVFACGGSNGSAELKTAEMFQHSKQRWVMLPDMIKARSSAGVVVLDERVYVIGGNTSIADCEMYDPKTEKWSNIAPLSIGRSEAAACVMDDMIVVAGGCDMWNCLNTVEVYSPENDTWTLLPSMNVARRGAGAVMFRGKLYVVGGNDGQSSLASVEIYNPETQSWSFGPSMNIARTNVGISLMGDRLFSLGGFSGKAFLDNAEYLTPDAEEWCEFLPAEFANNGDI